MRKIFFLLPLLLLFSGTLLATGGEKGTILRTVFFQDGAEVSESGKGSFRGFLPRPWRQDYTHWNAARAIAEPVNRGPEQFLRLKTESGAPQFLAQLSGIRPKKKYRLTAYLRNRTGAPVKLSLRILPPPYTTLSAGNWKPGDSWSTQTLYFQTPEFPSALPVGLLMNIERPGTLELATLKLEEFEGATAILRRPDARLNNVLRSTRFPLGLPPAWTPMRGHSAGTIESAHGERGPSGETPLLLRSRSNGKIGINSEPFNVSDPTKLHALTFSCRGTGNFQADLRCEGKELARLSLNPTEKWQRKQLEFQIPADVRAAVFRIYGSGTIHLDAFRIAPAGDSKYLSPFECEIALALPDSELKETGIQFPDEPALVRYAVTGEYEGGVLEGNIINLYGESRKLAPILLSHGNRTGTISYALFPGRELGQFRLELLVRKNGRPISPPAELIVTRIVNPAFWKQDASDSPFGIHVLPEEHSLKAVKAAGINWVRLHDAGTDCTGWFYLEPEKGKWYFRDAEIQAYRRNHLKIFGQLGTAPAWASHLSRPGVMRHEIAYHDRYFQPLHLNDFEHYVSTVVRRYRGVIDDWFVWNEPWVPGWWGIARGKDGGYLTSAHPQADFAKLTTSAYAAAKKQNPNAVISGFNTTAGREGETWTRGVLDSGGLAHCDTIDFHFYTEKKTGFPGDACEEAWNQALGPIRKKHGTIGKPVILSEGQGASLGSAAGDTSMRYAGMYHLTLPWKNEEDFHSPAERNVRYIVSFLSLGVKRIFLYSAHCWSDFSQAPSFLVLFNADGTPHPMLPAFSALAKRIENKKYIGQADAGNGIRIYFFSDGKKGTAVLFGPPAKIVERLKKAAGKIKLTDLYGNRVSGTLSPGIELLYAETSENFNEFKRLLQN